MAPPYYDPSSSRTALPFLFLEFVDGDAEVHATIEGVVAEAGVGEANAGTPDPGIGLGDDRAGEAGAGGIVASG